MLNILIGAAIGAVVNTVAYCGIQLWRGQPISGKALAGALVGGIVAGGLAGTTMGASLLAGTTTGALQFLAFDGAMAAGAEKVTENAIDRKALGDGVAEAAAWGALTAPATGMVLRGVGTQLSQLASEAAANAGTAAATEATTTAASNAAASAPRGAVSRAVSTAAKNVKIGHVTAPSFHALGTLIGHVMFGSPWVGEAVKTAKTLRNGTAKPVSPHDTTTTTTDSTADSTAAEAVNAARSLSGPSDTGGVTRALDLSSHTD